MFRDLRNHLHLSSDGDTPDFVRIRTSQGDRRVHRDLMLPWMEPSEKYPNADLYAKCRMSDTFIDGALEKNFDEIASKRAKLVMTQKPTDRENPLKADEGVLGSYDLQHHDYKDVELFLRILYGRVQENDVDAPSLGYFVAIAFDLGLYKLRQVMEEIIRHKLLHENPVDVMKFAAANNLYWLHVAAFDLYVIKYMTLKNAKKRHQKAQLASDVASALWGFFAVSRTTSITTYKVSISSIGQPMRWISTSRRTTWD